ncbi:hypothetical protein AGABI1DRAFT_119954 [Agaricus bisporus var. burnettii JB137-S8]|uniref:RNA polymerase I-specific transcription initiation factor RRN3 n=1 Tax=Agaricus bisporus var. burnettii (strain JB137-S8 / ATCC MYA-4627 / FGSC 10392) TaxID=597362 RepID=K5XA11_AGABU|nr:uncharacterized protein AGABI1DRAFT_119954 [Agaricus bisporus var. burnettii JB137-S8]EKM79897.1 hypothetical protein AGABI1DRAFT_119954 [Agaricus bisporus var. burnettii JB137-S8]
MDPHSRFNQFNKSGSGSPSTLLVRRPIATNSRIKQNENYRKDMYLAFVNNALQQKLNGISEPFNELVSQFNPRRRTTETSSLETSTSLRTWILALTHVVSRLERTHSSLVEAVINTPWTTLDSATVKSYIIFIGMLLSARPGYLSLVLSRVAQGFTYQSGIQTLSQAFPESSSSPITRRVIYDRLHYLLQHLLSLIPTLPSTLQPLLAQNFPHKRQNQLTQSTYIRNLLRISSYCPELSERILATIVDRALQIDVEIQVEIEELEEEETLEEQPLFELDPFDVVVGQEGPETSDLSDIDDSDEDVGDDFSDLSSEAGLEEELAPEVLTNMRHIQEMVQKLDSILTLVFDHFKRTSAFPPNNSAGSGRMTAYNASRPPSPPELLTLPPLPSFSDCAVTSPLMPTSTPPFLDGRTEFAPTPEPSTFPPPSTSSSQNHDPMSIMRIQFNALLSIFDRVILRTFKSRYTQFLIFWYTSLDPEFADIFQGMLVERALLGTSATTTQLQSEFQEGEGGPSNDASGAHGSTVARAAAASYIGSFVSRALFVDGESTRRVVALLCEFLMAHLDDVEESMRAQTSTLNIGGPQHTVFYAVSQAVFLIFCFRWRDLLDLEEEDGEFNVVGATTDMRQNEGTRGERPRKWMPELAILQRVVNSVLNPLRVCSSNVVMQFARVAQATDFIYCYTILESNKRLEYASTPRDPSATSLAINQPAEPQSRTPLALKIFEPGSVIAELNTFFPFDPYRLPRSSSVIKDVYREWSSVAIESESDDEEESEEERTEKDGFEVSGSGSSPEDRKYLVIPRREDGDDAAGGLGQSLEQMSISPRYRISRSVALMPDPFFL